MMSDLTFETLDYAQSGAVVVVTVNRPDARNALNLQALLDLGEAVAAFDADPAARVMILTGAGDKAFIAGADIAAMATMEAAEAERFSRLGQRVTAAMEASPKVIIGAINGFALGGGCEFGMACDFMIAAEEAVFGQPEVNLGLIPGFGGTQRLARLVGRAQARRLIVTGELVNAAQALEMGLVTQVVPRAALLETAKALAEQIAAKGPVAVGFAKQCINHGGDLTVEAGMAYEASLFGAVFRTDDMREGVAAFLGKRRPTFKGR